MLCEHGTVYLMILFPIRSHHFSAHSRHTFGAHQSGNGFGRYACHFAASFAWFILTVSSCLIEYRYCYYQC